MIAFDELALIFSEAKHKIQAAQNSQELENFRVEFLGKKSKLSAFFQKLKEVSTEDRRALGEQINQTRQEILSLIQAARDAFSILDTRNKLDRESIDITLPGRGQTPGALHPITQVRERVETLFSNLGFTVVEGPEVEEPYYNFTALNIPEHHPARAMHDTFYLENGTLLRTHTSPVQIRFMEKNPPPLRIIAPGRVYRCDSDLTHTPMFHQLEGLVVDEGINFSHLKGMLQQFLNCFFEKELILRFRPSYFPFTEPSAEVDMQCVHCVGKGCRVCSQTGWLEILGCGMVHPKIFEHLNIDQERYTGYAFGLGLDRLAMLRYGITDLRLMFQSDIRFLNQFR